MNLGETTERTFNNLTWETSTRGDASSTVVDSDALDLRVYMCSVAEATTELGEVDGTLSIPFDYRVESEGWYEYPEVRVTVDGERVYSTRDEIDADIALQEYATTTGSPTAKVSVDGNVSVSFRVKPSQFCKNFDHFNTYFDVRDIGISVRDERKVIEKSDLKDSNGNGIYDAVAEANPPLPQYLPDTSLFLPDSTQIDDKYRINIDPYALDTSGDGIPDSETIETSETLYRENGEWRLDVQVESAKHHPARVDTNGDGVPDRTQVEGKTIYYTPSSDATLNYIDAVQADNSPAAADLLDEYFISETATANPFLEYTTRVGSAGSLNLNPERISIDPLTDAENFALGTNPSKVDTTGDNVPDALAVADDLNPTLSDAAGPKVRSHYIWETKGGIEVGEVKSKEIIDGLKIPVGTGDIKWRSGTFETFYYLYDPAGIARTEYQYNGNTRASESLTGVTPRYFAGESTIEITNWETFTEPLTSNEVELVAEDANGNKVKREVYSDKGWQEYTQENFEELEKIPGFGDKLEKFSNARLGQLRGFTAGAEETLRLAYYIARNPRQVVESLSKIPDALRNLDEIIRALPASVQRQQQLDNPQLEPNDDDKPATCAGLSGDDRETCKSYADGWYAGYVGWIVFESFVPLGKIAGAGKAFEKIEELAPEQIRRYAAAAKSVREQVGAATQTTRVRIADSLATGKAISEAGAGRILDQARTVSQQLRVSRVLKNTDADTTLATSTEGQRLLGKILARTDGGDAGFLAKARICNSPCDPPVETLNRIQNRVDGVDSEDVVNLAATIERARDRGDIDIEGTEDFISDLERLSKQDPSIDGLDSVIKRASINSPPPSEGFLRSTFKGEVGTVKTAANALDAGKIVTELDDVIKTSSGKTDIDINLKDGTAIEVKNKDYSETPLYAKNRRQQELTTKLRKYAEESDTIVLATRGNPVDAEIPRDVKEAIESEFPDTTVDLKSIDGIKNI